MNGIIQLGKSVRSNSLLELGGIFHETDFLQLIFKSLNQKSYQPENWIAF
jgi:hypothetical protein